MSNIGYARTSTEGQDLSLQLDALKKAGCDKIFSDKISGRVEDREGLTQAIQYAREGDSIIVYSLSRLGRSLKHLIEVTSDFETRKIGLVSLTEQIDTKTATGRLLLHVLASLAQFEADLTRQRTVAGLIAAKERGRIGGRPKALSEDKLKLLVQLTKSGNLSCLEISKLLGVSTATFYRYKRGG